MNLQNGLLMIWKLVLRLAVLTMLQLMAPCLLVLTLILNNSPSCIQPDKSTISVPDTDTVLFKPLDPASTSLPSSDPDSDPENPFSKDPDCVLFVR